MTRNEIIEVAKGFYTDYFSEREIAFARLIIKQAEKLRQWQGLTDEEIAELHHEIKVRLIGTYKTEDIYRAIEAKLKEKNT